MFVFFLFIFRFIFFIFFWHIWIVNIIWQLMCWLPCPNLKRLLANAANPNSQWGKGRVQPVYPGVSPDRQLRSFTLTIIPMFNFECPVSLMARKRHKWHTWLEPTNTWGKNMQTPYRMTKSKSILFALLKFTKNTHVSQWILTFRNWDLNYPPKNQGELKNVKSSCKSN